MSWLAAFLTTDLAPFHVLLAGAVTAAFAWGGALASLPGQAAVLIVILSSLWLMVLWLPNWRAPAAAARTAAKLGLDETDTIERRLMLVPFKRVLDGVNVERDIEFTRRRRADYQTRHLPARTQRGPSSGAPVPARWRLARRRQGYTGPGRSVITWRDWAGYARMPTTG